ncbi:unnamed protein product [Peniophora sp. CBMAI 1063]|nr:unnamed protein product [Peniophora sp. CBMAI 1063]
MKLADKLASADKPFYTFEFFPPRTDQGFSNLLPRIGRLAQLKPQAVAITWGAGGSTKDRSLDLASLTQREYGIDTVLHLTCTNMQQGLVDDVLRAAKALGVQNIMALRGDPPRGEEYWMPADPRFKRARDLVSYIRSTPEFADHFSIGVAGYPDGHTDSVVNTMSEEEEIKYLKEKVDAGADYIVTQLFYDVDNFLRWLKRIRDAGITVPVIPGIMPLQTYASFQRLTKLTGAHIPAELHAQLEPIKTDDQKVKDSGVSLAISMIKRLNESSDVRGFHFCTLNLEKSVQRILDALGWSSGASRAQNKLITEHDGARGDPQKPFLLVTPAEAATSLQDSKAPKGELGKGEVVNASAWDEFPNGRFGDVASPAFGNSNQWGGYSFSNHNRNVWGAPRSLEDITNIFLAFLKGDINAFAFSPVPLSSETALILPHLTKLAERGMWPVGSQPAIDGARSDDETVGWGPSGGYVYQKAFVEFFCTDDMADALEKKVAEHGHGVVDLLMAQAEGGEEEGHGFVERLQGDRNAVTWGVFPAQEIVQSTMIESESFLSWKDEAFATWSAWAALFPPDAPERTLLERVRRKRWLVNVTHHDYKDADALWRFLLDD